MIVQNPIVFLTFERFNIFIKDWFELLNIITIYFKMNKSMTVAGFAICDLSKV